MTPDIQRKCVLIRSGLELWIEVERADKLIQALRQPDLPRFINIDNQLVNTYEIEGVFTPSAIEERTRRKNGQWKCAKGTWHDRSQKCECREYRETVTAHVEGVGEITYKR